MLIFIVADIWNCYNMSMKKATNLNLGGNRMILLIVDTQNLIMNNL